MPLDEEHRRYLSRARWRAVDAIMDLYHSARMIAEEQEPGSDAEIEAAVYRDQALAAFGEISIDAISERIEWSKSHE